MKRLNPCLEPRKNHSWIDSVTGFPANWRSDIKHCGACGLHYSYLRGFFR